MGTLLYYSYSILIFLCIVAQASAIALISRARPSQEQKNILIIIAMLCLFNIGYLCYFTATRVEVLALGRKLEIFSGLFIYMVMFSIIEQTFHKNFPKIIWFLLSSWQLFLLLMALTFDFSSAMPTSKWFFTDYYMMIASNGHRVLKSTIGWGHIAFELTIVFFMAVNIIIFLHKIIIAKNGDKVVASVFFVITIVPQAICFLCVIFPVLEIGFPFLPLSGAICALVAAKIVFEGRFTNLYDMAFFTVSDSLFDPLFVIDFDFFVRDANTAGKVLYPEYQKAGYKIDIKLSEELKRCILEPHTFSDNTNLLHIAGRSFIPEIHNVKRGQTMYGYVLILNDMTEQTDRYNQLEHDNAQLNYDFKHSQEKIFSMYKKIVSGIVNLTSKRDPLLASHMERTGRYVSILAKELQKESKYARLVSDGFIEILSVVAPLHDCGKSLIPTDVFSKQGSSLEDLELRKSHVEEGAKIIDTLFVNNPEEPFYKLGHEVTLFHHECWDGSGYPKGLKGEEIPLSARIVALCDEFDNLTGRQPQSMSYSFAEAYTTILSYSGGRFDPVVADAFKKCRGGFMDLYSKMTGLDKKILSSAKVKKTVEEI